MAIDWDSELLGPVMAEFGDAVIYTPRGRDPITLYDAVLDEAATTVAVVNGEEVTIQTPLLGIRTTLLNGVEAAQNDRVWITKTATSYLVKNAEPDGHGHVLCYLMKAQP